MSAKKNEGAILKGGIFDNATGKVGNVVLLKNGVLRTLPVRGKRNKR